MGTRKNKIKNVTIEELNNSIITEKKSFCEEEADTRDIRKAFFEDEDFNISYTDSTCPVTEILNQVREPGFDYLLAYNESRRVNRFLAKKWVFVDPVILNLRPSFDIDERTKDMITLGDTILMKRDIRYGKNDQKHQIQKTRSMMTSALSGFERSTSPITQITNIDNPFSN